MSTGSSPQVSTSAGQTRPAPEDVTVGTPPFPDRPLLTTPPRLIDPEVAKLERERLAAQPGLGLAGLLFAFAIFFALALGAGNVGSSLLIFGPLAAFGLAAIAMVAFWWEDWPGGALQPPFSGLVNTGIVVVAAVALTILGATVVERLDLRSIFLAHPGAARPTTFPATLTLAGATFAAMLELTLVSAGWPLRGLGRIRSGVVALVVAWAIAVLNYMLIVNTDSVPAAVRAVTGLRDPGGPVAAGDFGTALIAVGVWQALFFIGLRGWPYASISPRWLRILIGNVAVIGLGTLTYLVQRNLVHWQLGDIGAVCGCLIAAVLIVAMLFEGWPASRLSLAYDRLLTVALIAVVTVALDRALAAYAEGVHWARANPEDWVTTAALTFFGAGVILHVAVGRRWPLTPQSRSLARDSLDGLTARFCISLLAPKSGCSHGAEESTGRTICLGIQDPCDDRTVNDFQRALVVVKPNHGLNDLSGPD